ncbi:uncharacterized protein I206_107538 [Kwoniella pini CBS 10737]|uniref:ER membrane protein complex subunit 6 n=1 Tax=Kwoniella pini CBS 10737 TaxID=1296096 RepID=A0A1B9HXL0_9TREE|nr:uncharacterized protein I206_05866 [Kwoniella pini CBS 10737]OCF48000.1 hypothetical protein I206_05866 [Kwoniella pini CBS 10737]
MNPTAPPPTGAHLAPEASPLHPPSVIHNTRILSSLGTYSACFSGLIAGLLGLTNLYGFALYLISSIFTSIILLLFKCNGDVIKYVAQSHSNLSNGENGTFGNGKKWKGYWALSGIGQENLLGFLLFWIGSFALIHVYD